MTVTRGRLALTVLNDMAHYEILSLPYAHNPTSVCPRFRPQTLIISPSIAWTISGRLRL